jgi:hypothetical protein
VDLSTPTEERTRALRQCHTWFIRT